KAMADTWNAMATNVIENLIKVAAQVLIMHLLHVTMTQKEALTDAKAAAIKAAKAVADVPVIGPILAPIAAAGTFASLAAFMSFDKGGIMPADNLAMLHKNEMVLDPHLSA